MSPANPRLPILADAMAIRVIKIKKLRPQINRLHLQFKERQLQIKERRLQIKEGLLQEVGATANVEAETTRQTSEILKEAADMDGGPEVAEVLLSLADCPSVFLRDRPCGPVVCLDNGSAYVIPVMCSRLIDPLPFQSVALSHVDLLPFPISQFGMAVS